MKHALETPASLGQHIDQVDEYLEAIPEYVLARYQTDEGLSRDEAVHHAREAVRYLAMCADKPYANYGMSGQVDEFWHTFILFTKDYSTWCQATFGYFMHHTPTLPEEKEAVHVGDSIDTYALFYRDYSLFYGGTPPAIWPVPHMQMSDCGGGGCGGSSCGSSCGGSSCGSSCSTVVPSSCSSSPSKPSTPSRPRPKPSNPPKEKKGIPWPWKK